MVNIDVPSSSTTIVRISSVRKTMNQQERRAFVNQLMTRNRLKCVLLSLVTSRTRQVAIRCFSTVARFDHESPTDQAQQQRRQIIIVMPPITHSALFLSRTRARESFLKVKR